LRGLTYEQFRAELTPGCGSRERADEQLAALWRLARCDDEAGQALLAVLVPGFRAIAGRYQRSLGWDEAFAIAVGGAWERIARFDPPRSHVTYRLLWLAGRRVHRAAVDQEADGVGRPVVTGNETRSETGPEVSVSVTLLEAVRSEVVTRHDAWLVWATHCAGLALADAAELLGLGYEQAKKRRQRARAALETWLMLDGRASA
jgi:DNA-directed RNA polymerase specialized sigma24 family protein